MPANTRTLDGQNECTDSRRFRVGLGDRHMTTSPRSRVGVSLGLALGILALLVCAIPRIPAASKALRITGIWVGPSPYYVAAFMIAAAGLIAAATLVKRGECRAWKIIALVLGALGALLAFASLALSAIISIGMSS
jgi:hypothetical protein